MIPSTFTIKVYLLYIVSKLQCSVELSCYSLWFREYYKSKMKLTERQRHN